MDGEMETERETEAKCIFSFCTYHLYLVFKKTATSPDVAGYF